MILSKAALIGLAMALCLPVAGQEVPKAEIFGGYSFLSVSNKNLSDRQSLNGWEAAASVNITKLFAIEGDVSGHYKSVTVQGITGTASDYTYAGGPQINFKPLFAHVLVGADRVGASAFGFTASHTGLSVAAGGGFQYPVSRQWSARVSGDYVWNRHNVSIPGVIDTTQTLNNVRVSAGIVYTFGGRGTNVAPRQTESHASNAGVKVPALGIMAVLGRNPGAEVVDEAPNGTAALAGIHVGDVIDAVDGKPVRTPMELAAELANRAVGDKVKIGFLIRGQWQTETILLLGSY